MKKNVAKVSPLKVFNDNNAKAKIKAGGVMKSYVSSLKKAQKGTNVDPYNLKNKIGGLESNNEAPMMPIENIVKRSLNALGRGILTYEDREKRKASKNK